MAKNTQTPAPAASFLSTLMISNEKRAAPNAADPMARARANTLRGIADQLKSLEAALDGSSYQPTRVKYVDGADGKRVKVNAPKRALLWYFKSGDVWFTECRYGSTPMSFGDAGSTLRCGPALEDVAATLKTVAEAITAGELDKELASLAGARGRTKAAPQTPANAANRKQAS